MARKRRLMRTENRSSPEDPRVPVSAKNFLEFFGFGGASSAGINVTVTSALGVPAVWAAVNFLSGTLAGLPLHLYKKGKNGREKQSGPLATILHDAVSDEMSSFEWRKYAFDQVFTRGRSLSFIERDVAGRVINIWPLDATKTTITRKNGQKSYVYKENGSDKRYSAAEIIDLSFMLQEDGISSYSPIFTNRETVGLAIAATNYGSKFFDNGGVPPFVIEGPFQSPQALKRAADDLAEAVKTAAKEKRLALSLPNGHTIKPIGVDPEKSQLVELKRFVIEEIARIYQLPPTFLQDLTHGTFSNTEQQDLHFVKHTVKRWAEQFEQELNLKLFGRFKNRMYVEMSLDGLMRGDFKTRMDGYATAIQNGVLKPNEARDLENRPSDPDGDFLMIQGATVPIKNNIKAEQMTLPLDGGQQNAA